MRKLLTIIAAAGAGYVAGVLMAPKSGKETRKELSIKADKIKQVALNKAEDAKAAYDESAEKIKRGASEIGEETAILSQKARKSAGNIGKEASKLGAEAKRHLGKAAKSTSATARGVGQSFSRLK
ncbi:YtxH domain-containing protein [Candidatus Saccharibacteria bacterium]|jgi:gas vesicle protein|nr:YtxH domain-containing protein [Candidatus Saccharibacteria bacterium]